MSDIISSVALAALLQVIMIDLVLAGDNAVVIGLATAGLPAEQRRRAILVGILAATGLRIAFAGVATQSLQVLGLLIAGGILLLWVCWKMWRKLRAQGRAEEAEGEAALADASGVKIAGARRRAAKAKTLPQALLQIL